MRRRMSQLETIMIRGQ